MLGAKLNLSIKAAGGMNKSFEQITLFVLKFVTSCGMEEPINTQHSTIQ